MFYRSILIAVIIHHTGVEVEWFERLTGNEKVVGPIPDTNVFWKIMNLYLPPHTHEEN